MNDTETMSKCRLDHFYEQINDNLKEKDERKFYDLNK